MTTTATAETAQTSREQLPARLAGSFVKTRAIVQLPSSPPESMTVRGTVCGALWPISAPPPPPPFARRLRLGLEVGSLLGDINFIGELWRGLSFNV